MSVKQGAASKPDGRTGERVSTGTLLRAQQIFSTKLSSSGAAFFTWQETNSMISSWGASHA
eukprot:2504027-Amphidinium_carterae.1